MLIHREKNQLEMSLPAVYLKRFFVAVRRSVGNAYRFFLYNVLFKNIWFLKPMYYTRENLNIITFRMWFFQKVLGFNKTAYWPVHFTSTVINPKNIYVGIGAWVGGNNGCYIQALGKIFVDDYTQVAANVGIISSSHFMLDVRKHVKSEVHIGKYCRIGMGAMILPGVTLGDFTIVSTGAVVNQSFPKGYCVIAGNPARIVTDYCDNESIKEKFVRFQNKHAYHGFIPAKHFDQYRKKKLNI